MKTSSQSNLKHSKVLVLRRTEIYITETPGCPTLAAPEQQSAVPIVEQAEDRVAEQFAVPIAEPVALPTADMAAPSTVAPAVPATAAPAVQPKAAEPIVQPVVQHTVPPYREAASHKRPETQHTCPSRQTPT